MAATWVFGYGSLVYRPGFDFSKRVEGCIRGYQRVFHQGSTDHRGTPEYPGRTVTLRPCPNSIVWGAAYQLAGDEKQQAETLQYLEWREKQYDVRHMVDLYCSADSSQALLTGCLVYIASEDRGRNANYLGPAPEDDIALQIATAVGPSGPNCDYVFRLAEAMREMKVEDAELFRLEAKVRGIMEQRAGQQQREQQQQQQDQQAQELVRQQEQQRVAAWLAAGGSGKVPAVLPGQQVVALPGQLAEDVAAGTASAVQLRGSSIHDV